MGIGGEERESLAEGKPKRISLQSDGREYGEAEIGLGRERKNKNKHFSGHNGGRKLQKGTTTQNVRMECHRPVWVGETRKRRE